MRIIYVMALLSVTALNTAFSQSGDCTYDANTGTWRTGDGKLCPNAIYTAVPFLRISPDARASAMGDIGTVTSPDANSGRYNGATTAFGEKGLAIALNFSPWLRNISTDLNIFSITGNYKWDDLQAINFDLQYFDLGEIPFKSITGDDLYIGHPTEMAVAAGYARKLSENISLSASAKYIYSNLANGANVGTTEQVVAGHAFAADIGFRYNKEINKKSSFSIATSITNLGSKIKYIRNEDNPGDFLPSNLALGLGYHYTIDDFNSISIYFEANKLLVPTPALSLDSSQVNENRIPLYRFQGPIEAAINSFGDSDNGFKGELNEINLSVGLEYWYNELFAARVGYFYEPVSKGARRYFTTGFGINYSYFGFNFSYLLPTTKVQSPLDNTLKFSLIIDLTSGNDRVAQSEPIE